MPRTPKTPKSTPDFKPYARSSSSPPSSSPTPTSATKTRKVPETKGVPWTNDDYIQLFDKVAKAGMSRPTWEGAVEGRTPNQCYQAWL